MLVCFHLRKRPVPDRRQQSGYILLTLMLFLAAMTIAAVAIVPTVTFQIKRDREEEMIHRGVQYSRAVRRYVKKFGRFPTRVEDLLNTNNVRFLRQKYKDPITGNDFKLLHVGEVQVNFAGGIAGATPAANMPGANQPGTDQPGTPGEGLLDDAVRNGQDNPSDDTAATPNPASKPGPGGTNSSPGNGFSGPVFGGGPIVGVASTSKLKSIREFNNKSHYNQWQFIYDPTTDRGGQITGPYQPMKGMFPNQPGMQPAGNTGNNGSFSGFGGQNQNQNQPQPPAQSAPPSSSTDQ